MLDATTARWLGAAGDLLNLMGAVVLARDALMKYRDDTHLKNLKVTKSVIKLPFQYKKKRVVAAEDADRVFSVFTVWRAAWGCALLVAGFGIQLGVRLWRP
jgi:hypothetical protein